MIEDGYNDGGGHEGKGEEMTQHTIVRRWSLLTKMSVAVVLHTLAAVVS